MCLTAKTQAKTKSRSVKGIQIIRSLVIDRNIRVHASDITIIQGLVGRPRRSFLIGHGDAAFRAATTSSQTGITIQSLKGRTQGFDE